MAESESRLIGVSLLHELGAWAWRRQAVSVDKRRVVWVIVDEVERLATPEIAEAFEKYRGFGVRFVVAGQSLSQLKREDEVVFDAILANANLQVCFATRQRDDAEIIVRSMWAGHLDDRQVKDETVSTKFRPVESRRCVTTKSSSSSTSSSSSQTHSRGGAEGQSHARSGLLWSPDYRETRSTSNSMNRSDGHGSSESTSEGRSTSTSWVPFTAQEEFTEVSSRTFRSLEEQYEREVGRLMRQLVGQCTVALSGSRPMSVRVPYVAEPPVREDQFDAWQRACLKRWGTPTEEVLEDINGRAERFVAEHKARRREQRRHAAAVGFDNQPTLPVGPETQLGEIEALLYGEDQDLRSDAD